MLFADVCAVFEELCGDSRVKPLGRNRFAPALQALGVGKENGTGNVAYLLLPSPRAMLAALRRSSKSDKLVDSLQEEIIDAWAGRAATRLALPMEV